MKKTKVKILGVNIDKVTKDEVLLKIGKTIENNSKAQVATVNPEFIIEAQKNSRFRKVLNNVNLSVADGVGILAAAKFNSLKRSNNPIIRVIQSLFQGLFLIGPSILLNKNYLNTIPEVIAGSDLTYYIARFASQKDFSIYLLGARPGIAERAAQKLVKKYPELKIAGCYAGSPNKHEEMNIIERINRSNPDILLVAYGAPAQDLWISRNLGKLKSPLVAMGVGGTFDFIAGYKDLEKRIKVRRAPKAFRRLGLEWVYRLFQEPRKRAGRIWNAAAVFPLLVWKKSLKK
jgi:N-acetylglucosaminyldiphosphoundecaprenol N-acetyl-beta-D-mannosaminyltransferase